MTEKKLEIQEVVSGCTSARIVRYYNPKSRLDYAGNHVAEIAEEKVQLIGCDYEETAPPWRVFCSTYLTESGRLFKVREEPRRGGEANELDPSAILRNVKLGRGTSR